MRIAEKRKLLILRHGNRYMEDNCYDCQYLNKCNNYLDRNKLKSNCRYLYDMASNLRNIPDKYNVYDEEKWATDHGELRKNKKVKPKTKRCRCK